TNSAHLGATLRREGLQNLWARSNVGSEIGTISALTIPPPRKRGEVKKERADLPRRVPQRLQQIRPELRIILYHGEVPHAFHDGEPRARNRRRDCLAHLRRAGIIVLAGEQRDIAAVGVDPLDVLTPVPVI